MKLMNFSLILPVLGFCKASPIKATQTEATFPLDIGFQGHTSTAEAPFLAATNAAAAVTGKPAAQHKMPMPIETSVQSFDHCPNDRSIYELFATISPYYVSDEGWGVYNYALPGQCTIKQAHFLQRHGSRYPDSDFEFPDKFKNATMEHEVHATGDLEFLNDWKLKMGVNVLTTLGNNQLFNNGVKTFFRYGQLFNFSDVSQKIVARTTSEQRMIKSAEYFLTGFFGLDWKNYANLELIIEKDGYNSTLSSWDDCKNNDASWDSFILYPELDGFQEKYLKDAEARFNAQISGYNFSYDDLYELQTICAYETNILGFSHFCSLFSQKEWEYYEYYQSVVWYAQNAFGNPLGRALGIGWVQEFLDRLTNQTYSAATQSSENSTFNSNPAYFPLDQSLYMDFTHDSVIHTIITALGFEQFKANWTFEGPETDKQFYDLSKITPFAAQLAFEVIECDSEVPADRAEAFVNGTEKTSYIHAILNDNTLSLPKNIPQYCEDREDGWCEYNSFIEYLNTLWDTAQYEYSCTGNYNYSVTVHDGVPE